MRASGVEFTASAGEPPLEIRAMTQATSLFPPIILNYENTLVLAIELSKTKWVLAAQVPGLPRVKANKPLSRGPRRCLQPLRVTGIGRGRRDEQSNAWSPSTRLVGQDSGWHAG